MNENIGIILQKERQFLTNKAPHTKYKIQYVSEYVKNWGYVTSCNISQNINFIDCMCNAGVYTDGDFCSAVKVLKIFRELAYQYPEKNYNIFLNDYDSDKIRIIKLVCKSLYSSYPQNLTIYYENMDVNDYLYYVKKQYKSLFAYPSMTILYVDPYSFHTVKIPAIEYFLKSTYCELLFNLFTSDFNRNKLDNGIIDVLGGNYNIRNIADLVEHIKDRLKNDNMKYFLSYPFRQSRNVELYQIFFAGPNEKGLEKIKDALWNVFDGAEFYKTDLNIENGQISLFSNSDNKDEAAKKYSTECVQKILERYAGRKISYLELEKYILENSLLKTSHVIRYIIKPMIMEHHIIKQGLVRNNNYKKDEYFIKG